MRSSDTSIDAEFMQSVEQHEAEAELEHQLRIEEEGIYNDAMREGSNWEYTHR